jgi:hypothetical protein
MNPANEQDALRVVRKYIRRRERSVIRGEAAPGFPVNPSLLFHIVPEDFDPLAAESAVRGFSPFNIVPRANRNDWKGRFTRHGYRFDLASAEGRAIVGLLHSGAVEFGVVPAGEHGIDWSTVEWVFTEALYELARFVWSSPSKPKVAFLSLLVTGATPEGIVGVPESFVANYPNVFEETKLRLGPLVMKIEEVGTRQFQPMFDLLFQCAGFRNAPGLLDL